MRWTAALILMLSSAAIAGETSLLSVSTDRFEHHFDHDTFALDSEIAWRSDARAFLLRLDGVKPEHGQSEGELQLLYTRPLSAYFDWQVGAEIVFHDGDDSTGVLVGVEGDAPYRIETEARLTLDEHGNVTVHAEFEKDLLLTQKLVLQPRVEIVVGDADKSVATELRLRYETTRKFAPYIGISWQRLFGDIDDNESTALAGITFWF